MSVAPGNTEHSLKNKNKLEMQLIIGKQIKKKKCTVVRTNSSTLVSEVSHLAGEVIRWESWKMGGKFEKGMKTTKGASLEKKKKNFTRASNPNSQGQVGDACAVLKRL